MTSIIKNHRLTFPPGQDPPCCEAITRDDMTRWGIREEEERESLSRRFMFKYGKLIWTCQHQTGCTSCQGTILKCSRLGRWYSKAKCEAHHAGRNTCPMYSDGVVIPEGDPYLLEKYNQGSFPPINSPASSTSTITSPFLETPYPSLLDPIVNPTSDVSLCPTLTNCDDERGGLEDSALWFAQIPVNDDTAIDLSLFSFLNEDVALESEIPLSHADQWLDLHETILGSLNDDTVLGRGGDNMDGTWMLAMDHTASSGQLGSGGEASGMDYAGTWLSEWFCSSPSESVTDDIEPNRKEKEG